MAQPCEVMAFRKRLKKRGYTDIKIVWDTNQEVYQVTAVEPLAGQEVITYIDRWDMIGKFR